MLRQVHEQRAVGLFFGQRALCIGALKPLNYVGTSLHTKERLRPFRRLVRTANFFETIFFGTKAEADVVLNAVQKMHARVNGDLPEDAGPWPAGSHYDAFDPELMWWTVAVIEDSAIFFYELFVGELTDDELEALHQDYVKFAELFGMPRSAAPATYREFREWFDAELHSDRVWLTDEARYVGAFTAFEIPLPSHLQLSKKVHDMIMMGSIPPVVREHYGFEWSPARERAFRAAVALSKLPRPLMPEFLRVGYNTRFFATVQATEARRIRRGKPTPQLREDFAAPPRVAA
jgi:uncharacterized protein (DUF2236 family)